MHHLCLGRLSVFWWYRTGQKPEQFTMDTDPSDCSPHQQQQPEPDSSRNRKAATSRLPEPVLQQTAQPASRTRQHGDSQVCLKSLHRCGLSKIILLCRWIFSIITYFWTAQFLMLWEFYFILFYYQDKIYYKTR